MSELSNTKEYRQKKLLEISHLVIKTGNAKSFIVENKDFINTVVPDDFIKLFDTLVQEGVEVEALKICANKVLNVFYTAINSHVRVKPPKNSLFALLESNSVKMEELLDEIGVVFKVFAKDNGNKEQGNRLKELFEELDKFMSVYVIKENIIFPVVEQHLADYRCLQIMWSFHDDIRNNIKYIIEALTEQKIDAKEFNRKVGDIFFNMLAIKFREEHILYPYILKNIDIKVFDKVIKEAEEIGFPYVMPEPDVFANNNEPDNLVGDNVDLGTGNLSVEQIKLIFNHLPVDITYVDENDEVRFFSTPKKRIFPRTTAIIGRKVSNCHPPESVHVVERIVEEFRNGTKDFADFWIEMKGEFVLIRYFAVRDSKGEYRGVVEVTQEVSDIRALEGQKRLLDWD